MFPTVVSPRSPSQEPVRLADATLPVHRCHFIVFSGSERAEEL